MIRLSGREISKKIGAIADFFLDRYEVTNKEFKEFVDKGGYQKQEYWEHKFVKNGKELSWLEAMSEFVDATGRLGPSIWQVGHFPEAQEDLPVSGVSCYEAAAYAEFAGKNVPSVYHRKVAAGFYESDFMHFPSHLIPMSNFEGNGPAFVRSDQGMTAFGAFDMVGNMREWCWNDSFEGKAVCGGAWNDITYMYGSSQQPAFDRSPRNGFRCVVYLIEGKILDSVFAPTEIGILRDFYKERPVSY
jgi:formylglycine-generating enzyme required for sulfatase activity